MKICYHYISVLLLVTAFFISGCKDGPFSSSSEYVDVSGRVLFQSVSDVLIPVANARIETIGQRTSAYSLAGGQFSIVVKPGKVTFVVTHDDYFELEVTMEIKKSGNNSVDLIFTPDMLSASTHGVVYDSRYPLRDINNTGIPSYTAVPGVRVFIDGEEKAFTDYQGRFVIDRIRVNTVKEITFMKSNWETETVDFGIWNRTRQLFLNPILREYYTFEKGNYWIFDYYSTTYNQSYSPDISRVGEYKWEVIDVHNDNDGAWYELRTELVYKDYQSRIPSDSTYIESGTSITTLRVRQDGWRYRITKNNGSILYNLTKDFFTGSPDEVTEKKDTYTHGGAISYHWHKDYQLGVGLTFREYKRLGGGENYTESWDLIDSGTR